MFASTGIILTDSTNRLLLIKGKTIQVVLRLLNVDECAQYVIEACLLDVTLDTK